MLTSRWAYIRFKGKELCWNQAVVNWGFVLALDAAASRDDESRKSSGGFLFSTLEVNGRVWPLQNCL
jgi:hypothetical protein